MKNILQVDNQRFGKLPAEIILYGGTGQAKVDRDIIEAYGSHVVAVVDDTPGLVAPFADVPLLFGQSALVKWLASQERKNFGFTVAIGSPQGGARMRIQSTLIELGLEPVTLVHPFSWVALQTEIGVGSQVMAGVVIGAHTQLGQTCIVNTKASVDHECVLADGVSIAPGATLCGLVHVGANVLIGAGATILPRVRIGANAIIGAGAVVIRDVPPGACVVGVPAKELEKCR